MYQQNNELKTSQTTRDLQLASLSLLTAIDTVCRQHGLTYYLIAGTLLGAVRHGGFIPWDDDMDIGMPRKDYDLLMQHAQEWLPKPFRIVNHENDAHYPKYFAKIENTDTTLIENKHLGYVGGIYCDIFALDNVPDSLWRRRLHYTKFNLVRRLLYLAYRNPYKHGHGPSSWLPLMVQKCFSKPQLHRWAQRLLHKYGDRECQNVMTFDDGFRAFPKTVLGKPQRITFEGIEANAPADTDRFLSIMYGPDYMTPPPEGQRREHGHYYFDTNTPYSEFQQRHSL